MSILALVLFVAFDSMLFKCWYLFPPTPCSHQRHHGLHFIPGIAHEAMRCEASTFAQLQKALHILESRFLFLWVLGDTIMLWCLCLRLRNITKKSLLAKNIHQWTVDSAMLRALILSIPDGYPDKCNLTSYIGSQLMSCNIFCSRKTYTGE